MAASCGLVLVATGLLLFGTGDPAEPGLHGWYAYAPLAADAAFESQLSVTFDDAVVWTDQRLLGAGVAVLGLLLLAATGGWALGRRMARSGSSTAP